jgi:hypothetical protein
VKTAVMKPVGDAMAVTARISVLREGVREIGDGGCCVRCVVFG